MKYIVLCAFSLVLLGCQSPQRGSEEYWYKKLVDEQRAQCRLLPEPLASSCLVDVQNKNYQDFVKKREQQNKV